MPELYFDDLESWVNALTMPGLRGLIINFRQQLDVMSGLCAADAEGFSPAATSMCR